MKIPEISEFKFLEEFSYWFAKSAQKDEFDIIIADNNGKPREEAHSLMKRLLTILTPF